MANQVLMTISRDEEERARLMRDEKILLDYYSGISYAKREERKEVARNLKNLGVSFDMIQKATGLSIEEINRL